MQFHDHSQHVTIGISSDHVPAGVRLQSARFRVLECMPQIGERDAALLHPGPGMILLTPKHEGDRRYYLATGSLDLSVALGGSPGATEQSLIRLVAGAGFEPATFGL